MLPSTRCQDWTSMDLADESCDLVLCDGGLTFFSYPDALQQLANNITRIMAPGGRFIVRLYLDANRPITPGSVFSQLESGEIRNSSELKLLLWFALHRQDGTGVRLRRLAQQLLLNDTLHGARHGVLRALVSEVGESCNLTALSGSDVIYLDRVETPAPLRFYL
ncbi:MAG: methyltransferase domain-containing protein, partial [Rhodobacteraceae bacterium]|nr:methyltransferase domain-containing protein [Paracoccaceae bacterium]